MTEDRRNFKTDNMMEIAKFFLTVTSVVAGVYFSFDSRMRQLELTVAVQSVKIESLTKQIILEKK